MTFKAVHGRDNAGIGVRKADAPALRWLDGRGGRPHMISCRSSLRPVALLEFLARAAGAGIVAAHFFLTANDLLHRLHVAAPAMRACSSSRRLRRMKASSRSSAEVATSRGG